MGNKRHNRSGVSPSHIVSEANEIGQKTGHFCNYTPAGGKFIYKFFRRGSNGAIYLGSTQLPHTVVERMTAYCRA